MSFRISACAGMTVATGILPVIQKQAGCLSHRALLAMTRRHRFPLPFPAKGEIYQKRAPFKSGRVGHENRGDFSHLDQRRKKTAACKFVYLQLFFNYDMITTVVDVIS